MNFDRKHIPLMVALAVPIGMILLIAGSVYLPGLFIQPKTNFLYASPNGAYSYPAWEEYSVEKGELVRHEYVAPSVDPKLVPEKPHEQKLYIYDVMTDTSREISFEEAKKLMLDSDPKSPDGFEVVAGTHGGGVFPLVFFSDTDYSTRYLSGHNVSRKLNITLDNSYYSPGNFLFLGWIR